MPIKDRKDTLKQVSAALPNAANTVNSNVIDLEQTTPYPVTQKLLVQIATTQSTGANSKNVNIVIQHSAESSANFTSVAELAPLVIGGNTTNYPATTSNVSLPPAVKRYIRASATGEANGGNAGDGTFTVSLLF